jgi:hypothetical protein
MGETVVVPLNIARNRDAQILSAGLLEGLNFVW